jgi:drug/metabolite transporter (DMT)-like permease
MAPQGGDGSTSTGQSFSNMLTAGENDPNEPASGADPTLRLIQGANPGAVTSSSGIYEESAVNRLPESQRQAVVASPSGRATQVALFVLCAICGSMYPLVQQWTKSYPATYIGDDGYMYSCDGKEGHMAECKGGMAYLPGTAVMGEKVASLTVGLTLTVLLSGQQGLKQCVSPARLKMTAPVASFYVIGDIVQFMAIGATNAAFFTVISQIKLLVTAVIASLVLKTRQSPVQWLMLGAVTIACGLYCDLELYFVQEKGRGEMEAYGLALALTKVFLASTSAVLTERAFKAAGSGSEPIWVNQVQLNLCALPCSIVVLALQHGPAMCSHEKGDCLFVDKHFFHGWSYKNFVLICVQVFSNFVVCLVYKKVNAVVKYLAYAQSLWITYFLSIAMLGVAFNLDLFLVIVLLVLLVVTYSFAKVAPAPSTKEAAECEESGFERQVSAMRHVSSMRHFNIVTEAGELDKPMVVPNGKDSVP